MAMILFRNLDAAFLRGMGKGENRRIRNKFRKNAYDLFAEFRGINQRAKLSKTVIYPVGLLGPGLLGPGPRRKVAERR